MDGKNFMEHPIKHGMIWGVKTPLFLEGHPYLLSKYVFQGVHDSNHVLL